MTTFTSKPARWLAASTLLLAAAGCSQQSAPIDPAAAANSLVGSYRLDSYQVEPPDKKWFFTKGRIDVTRLDDTHLLMLFACEWKGEPKAQCWEWETVRQGADGIYLTDFNSDAKTIRFDPARRTLTITMEGSKATRTDQFVRDDSALTDPALVRRMKRAQSSFDGSIAEKSIGHYSAWTYARTRIYP